MARNVWVPHASFPRVGGFELPLGAVLACRVLRPMPSFRAQRGIPQPLERVAQSQVRRGLWVGECQRQPSVATKRQKVQATKTVVAFQSFGHEPKSKSPPASTAGGSPARLPIFSKTSLLAWITPNAATHASTLRIPLLLFPYSASEQLMRIFRPEELVERGR
jgi:hypothetical protein